MRFFGVAVLLALVTSSVAAHDPITTTVTYAREVRAIVGTRCVTCHAPGGSAPMPLTTYEETRPWARAIKEQVLTRRMPKWQAARGFGAFANDPTLTPFEIALLVSWIDGGLPRDARSSVAGATAPVPTLSPAPPPLSRPRTPLTGNVLSITLPAGVAELSRPIGRRWVTGWDFQPGDPLITSATLSLADGTSLGNWVAGDRAVMLPPQTAKSHSWGLAQEKCGCFPQSYLLEERRRREKFDGMPSACPRDAITALRSARHSDGGRIACF